MKKYNIKSTLLALFCLTISTAVKAQSNYTGTDVESLSKSGETFYLYNVDTGKFLYPGNTQGTSSSLLYGDLGYPLKIEAGADENVAGFYNDYDDNDEEIPTYDDELLPQPFYKVSANYGSDSFWPLGLDQLTISPNDYTQSSTANLSFNNNYGDNGNRWIVDKVDGSSNEYVLHLYNVNDGRYFLLKAGNINSSDNTDVISSANAISKFTLTAEDAHTSNMLYTNFFGDEVYTQVEVDGNSDYDEDRHCFHNLGSGKSYVQFQITFRNKKDGDPSPIPEGTYDISITYANSSQATENLAVFGDIDGETELFSHTFTDIQPTNGNQSTLHFCFKTFDDNDTYNWALAFGSVDIESTPQEGPAPDIYGITITKVPDFTDDANVTGAKWKFVPESELKNILTSNATKQYGSDTNADATFLMKDQGFTYSVDGSAWKKSTDNGDNATITIGNVGDDAANNKYSFATISGKGKVYQEFEVPNSGVYEFDAYGFSKGSPTSMYYQYYVNGKLTDAMAPKALVSADPADKTGVQIGQDLYNDAVLNQDQNYKNTMMIYVPENADKGSDGYKIRLGFDKSGSVDGDYTAVDDIHLHYKGQSPFVLDGNWEDATKNNAINGLNAEKRTSVPVYIKRTFWRGAWNPLVLPVSVTKKQLTEIFGTNVKLAKPYGLIGYHPTTMRFTTISLANRGDDDAVVEAGKYYLVFTKDQDPKGETRLPYIEKGSDDKYVALGDNAETGNNRYFFLGNYDLSTALPTSIDPLDKTHDDNGNFHPTSGEENVEVVGGYANFAMPPYSYVFNSRNQFYHYLTDKTTTMGAFKFYVHSSVDDKTPGAKGGMGFAVDEDNTTGIQGVSVADDGSSRPDSGVVYSLSGVRVSDNGNTDSLPAGIYIIDGRKFIKR